MRRVVYASTLLAALGWSVAAFGDAEARGPGCVRTAKGKVTCGAAVGSGKTASSQKSYRRTPAVAEPDDRRAARSTDDEAFLDALVRHRDALARRGGRLPPDDPIDTHATPRRGAAAAATRDAPPPAPQSAAVRPSDGAPSQLPRRSSAVALPPPRPLAADGPATARDAAFTGPATARHVVFADPGRQASDRVSPRRPATLEEPYRYGHAVRARAASHPETLRDDSGRRLAAGATAAQPRGPAYPDSRPYADDARQNEPDGPAGKGGEVRSGGGDERAPQ